MSCCEYNNVTLTNGGKDAELFFPGIPYCDFDRGNHLSIWALARIFEAARHLMFACGQIDFPQIHKDRTVFFLAAEEFEISSEIHTNVCKLKPYPTCMSMSVLHVRPSSITVLCTMRNSKTMDWLAANKLKLVAADKHTRKPVELPDWFQKKHGHIQAESSHRLDRKIRPDTPANALIHSVIVRHSDLDSNGHVNHGHYVQFLMDCATEAALSGSLSAFKGDMCLYPARSIQMDYIGESKANDKLMINMWEDQQKLHNLHFSIDKGEKRIVYAKIEFYLKDTQDKIDSKI